MCSILVFRLAYLCCCETFLLQEILRLGYLEGRSTCLALTVLSGGCIKVGSIAEIGVAARQSCWLHLLVSYCSQRDRRIRGTRGLDRSFLSAVVLLVTLLLLQSPMCL